MRCDLIIIINKMPLKSQAIFDKIGAGLAEHGKGIVAKVGAIFHFEIAAVKGETPEIFTLNLKEGNGKFVSYDVRKML